MDYAGLLSQKRAEESRFRSGWDPIGSPTGLSRSTLGGGLEAAESALQRLDSFGGGSTYGGGSFGGGYQGGFAGGGSDMSSTGYHIGNSGDAGDSRKTMQENYRRDLIKQAEEDRARKQAEREMERQGFVTKDTGLVSTIYKPTFLDAGTGGNKSRRGSSVYGDDLAQQIEQRRQKQERDRNNLIMFQQQQQAGGGPLGFGGDTGGRRRPHVSETSFERSQRTQSDSIQATLQQQIADKKQREAERKRREAEEDAALNARLEEQLRKVREDAQREQEARQAKERGRLERQRLIEEQQKRSQEEAAALKRAARDRRQGSHNVAANDWGNWSDNRSAGGAARSDEDLWQKPAEELWPTPLAEPPPPSPPPPPPPPPPEESKPDTPPPEIHPSQDTSDLVIGFNWDRAQTEQADVRLDSPQLDDLAKRNRDRQRRLDQRKKSAIGGQN